MAFSGSSGAAMHRSDSQASDGTRSGDSPTSPATAATLYTPDAGRYKSSGRTHAFGRSSESAFDMNSLRNVLPLTGNMSSAAAALSATANSFTPTNSRLAQLTATSTPDDSFTTPTRSTHHVNGNGMASSSASSFILPNLDHGHTLTSSGKGKGKMPAAEPALHPDATRYVLIKTSDPDHLALMLKTIKEAGADQPVIAGVGGAIAYRFDSIRMANAAVAEALKNFALSKANAQVSFISARQYKEFDPNLINALEGIVDFYVAAPLPAAELLSVALEEARRFGALHAYEVIYEEQGLVCIKIVFDSVNAAEAARQQLSATKPSCKYQDARLHVRRSNTPPGMNVKKASNDWTHLHGDGVRLNTAYGMKGMGALAAPSTSSGSSALAPLRTPSAAIGQPSLHFSSVSGATYPPRLPTSVVPSPYAGFNSMTNLMPRPRRSRENSCPVVISKIQSGQEVRTTIMLRNIPNKMTAAELKQIIDKTSWGRYDFSYLRIDFKNQCNVGYAFINFIKPEYIIDFYLAHNGRPWGLYNSDKIAEFSYATRQGLSSLIDLFQNSCVMEERPEHRPKLWYTEADNTDFVGHERTFPEPTNYQKLQRSRDMANTVGLFPPRANRGFHQDERHRMSQYDRGTPQAIRDAQLSMAAYHGMGYPQMGAGFPAIGNPLPYPYGYQPMSPFYPPVSPYQF